VPNAVGPTVVSDVAAKKELEIDVAACSGDRVLALGEAKWTSASVGLGELARLAHKKNLLGPRAASAKLLLFSCGGFDRDLRARARRLDVELVDMDRLYEGD
jgi:hypothetical protein